MSKEQPPKTTTTSKRRPEIVINAQYIKDLSFENPNVLHNLDQQKQPDINIQLSIKTARLKEDLFEVALLIRGDAEKDKKPVFVIELVYAGVFTLKGMPEKHLQPVLCIEAPRLLFPFARNIIATMTRESGLLPLMLQPVDFAELYRRQNKK